MAAGTKTFNTQFRIGATWTGQQGVSKAQRALGGLAKTAHTANVRVRGMARSVFAGVAAYDLASKAVAGLTQTLVKSFAAASEAQEAHDELGLSIERNASRYKNTMGKSVAETTAIVEESTKALIAASEVMERTGHDAETLQKGWAKLAATGALDPKQILAQRDAFSDVLSYTAGANATAEESAQLGELWADAILRGNIALAKQMDLTTGEIAQFQQINKLIKEGTITGEEGIKRRQSLVLKFASKFEGETKRVFEKPSGKIAQMWTQIGNIFETLGEPFVARAPEFAESFAKIAREMGPVAEKLAKEIAPALTNVANWFAENTDTIVSKIETISNALKGIGNVFMWLQEKSEAFFKPMYEWLEKKIFPALTKYQDLTGTGKSTPTVPKAMDWRYPSGAPSGTYPSGAPAATESFYEPGGPSAMPGKIGAATPTTADTVAANGDVAAKLDAKLGGRKGQGATIVAAAKKHGVDPYMLAAIAQTESAKGTSYSIRNRNAPVGMMKPSDPSQHQSFASLEAGIDAGAALLKRGYISQGRTTPAQIGAKWAPPGASNDPNRTNAMWPGLVTKEMARLKATAGPQGDRQTGGTGERTQSLMEGAMMRSPGGAGGSLKHMIKEMNLQQRTSGGTGGQNIAMNAPITVNGVAPGREALMAKKTALALRDPTAQLLTEIKRARTQEQRLGYV